MNRRLHRDFSMKCVKFDRHAIAYALCALSPYYYACVLLDANPFPESVRNLINVKVQKRQLFKSLAKVAQKWKCLPSQEKLYEECRVLDESEYSTYCAHA